MMDAPEAFNLSTLPHPTPMHNPASQLFDEDFVTKTIWWQRSNHTMAGCLTSNTSRA
jgi:hypothetical protein